MQKLFTKNLLTARKPFELVLVLNLTFSLTLLTSIISVVLDF